MPERCPSCGASVRAGADWCTLCYADLRPAPPPPPPPPPPAPEPVPVAAPVPVGMPAAAPDPLSAPYEHVLGAAIEGTPPADPAPVPTWPCLECDARNSYDDMACATCGSAFGSKFSTRVDPGARKDRMVKVLAGLGAFLALFAVVMFVATPEPPAETVPGMVVEQGADR